MISDLISQASDATLEEFLEELDALTDSDKDLKDQDSLAKLDSLCAREEVRDLKEVIVPRKKAQALWPRGSERKVRFSEELVQNAPAEQPSQDSAGAESKGSLKVSSPKKNKREVERPQLPATKQDDSQGKGGSLPALPVVQQPASETEHTEKERTVPSSPPAEKASASLQPVSKGSSNSANTGTAQITAEDEQWCFCPCLGVCVHLYVRLAKYLVRHLRKVSKLNLWLHIYNF